jgi:hypothetical protein
LWFIFPVASGKTGLHYIIVVTVAGIAQFRAGFPVTQVCNYIRDKLIA